MVKKTVHCPNCGKIVTCSGEPGDVVKIICSSCFSEGKVTFEKTILSLNAAIEVSDLKKVYGDLVAVNNISFTVQKGEVFAFLGPNGAGKTTTVEMIESIRQPTTGDIKIFGKDIKTSFDGMKEKIGILPQEFHSFEKLTVKETLVYFSKLYKKRADIDSIINAMDLKDEEKKYYKDLSGGLKQRVGVAISLVNDPDIVFLDEPTTGLDPKARREVWAVIANLRDRGKTVFLTTHYMEEAEYLADHIAIIHKGKIIAEGSLDELINKYGDESILRIKNCSSKNAVDVLKENGFEAKTEGNSDIAVRIEFKERVLEVLSILKHECIDYDNIDIRRSNLEEIFLKITGAKLSEADE
ncbi:MAG: ABC transporter ATP-binding protein [Thermoplasmatales archaeon]|nr:ABC transporter ATP-binding protein [Thermoplasmatales archaeon]